MFLAPFSKTACNPHTEGRGSRPPLFPPVRRHFSTAFYTGYTHGKNRLSSHPALIKARPPPQNTTLSSLCFVSIRSLCCTVKQCLLQLFLPQARQNSFHHNSLSLRKSPFCDFFYFIVTFSAFSRFFPIIKGLFADMNVVNTSVFKYLVFSRY